MPICTVERKRFGESASSRATRAPLSPASTRCLSCALREETSAVSDMAKRPLRRVRTTITAICNATPSIRLCLTRMPKAPNQPYSPECVEGLFSEVRQNSLLRVRLQNWAPGSCADPRARRTLASRRALLFTYFSQVPRPVLIAGRASELLHISGRGLRLRGLLGGETITVPGEVRTPLWPRSRGPLQVIPETSLCVRHRLLLSSPARYLLASRGAGQDRGFRLCMHNEPYYPCALQSTPRLPQRSRTTILRDRSPSRRRRPPASRPRSVPWPPRPPS